MAAAEPSAFDPEAFKVNPRGFTPPRCPAASPIASALPGRISLLDALRLHQEIEPGNADAQIDATSQRLEDEGIETRLVLTHVASTPRNSRSIRIAPRTEVRMM